MDVDDINSWISQPDVCRCCLSASGTLDLTASYISDEGVKEVYCDMLQECYGISLSCLSEGGPSRLVCAQCVCNLRDASDFKKQVLQADERFQQYYGSEREGICEFITMKIEPEQGDSSDECTEQIDVPDKDSRSRELPKPKLKLNKNVRKLKKKRGKRTIKENNQEGPESDSDTPISQLTKKSQNDKNNGVDSADFNAAELDATESGQQPVTLNTSKQISERRRVMLTCAAILRDTTACPFRHHKSWFKCFFCQQDFMQLSTLRSHTNETHWDVETELKKIKRYPRSLQIDISNLECRHCNLSLTDVNEMQRHLEDGHGDFIYTECIADYKVDGSPYACHLCRKEFHVFRTLTVHLNEHYANCICDVCGKSFLNSKRLRVHKRTHENGIFPCSECGKVLKTKSSKVNHMESAHAKRVMKCQICLKPMKHYNERIKHMSEVHNITHKFKCPICAREYNIKHYLATHIRQTHGNKNKKCAECGMAFITNHGLKKHMLKHTGEKPFACALCAKTYARSYTLKEHMRAHENDRRLSCID